MNRASKVARRDERFGAPEGSFARRWTRAYIDHGESGKFVTALLGQVGGSQRRCTECKI